MKRPSTLAIVFNGAALLVAGASGIAILRSVFSPADIPACSQRYDHGTQMSLERGPGDLLTPADLQARFGGQDWGVLENARVIGPDEGAVKQAIEVRFAKLAATASQDGRSGMEFVWTPRLMSQGSSACLSYAVRMPKDFDFSKGGRLPGLLAGPQDRSKAGDIAVRSGWTEGGSLDILMRMPGWPEPRSVPDDRKPFALTRGTWVALEQEVILNTAGQKDGVVRIWADGALQVEKTGLAFRDNADTKIVGVIAGAEFHGPPGGGAAAGKSKLWLSPFELRWQ